MLRAKGVWPVRSRVVCVYSITNVVNGKLYIGSTVDYKVRVRQHTKALTRNGHHNSHLQAAWNKYGGLNFVFDIIEECHATEVRVREQAWIDNFSFGMLYNLTPTVESTSGWRKRPVLKSTQELIVTMYTEFELCIADLILIFPLSRRDIERALLDEGIIIRSKSETKLLIGYRTSGSRNPMSGVPRTAKQLEVMRLRMVGSHNPAARAILQLTLEGEIVAEWPSAAEAARALGIKGASQISNVCRGAQVTCKGFKWKYKI